MIWGKGQCRQGTGKEKKKLKWVNVNDSWKMILEKCIETAYAQLHWNLYK